MVTDVSAMFVAKTTWHKGKGMCFLLFPIMSSPYFSQMRRVRTFRVLGGGGWKASSWRSGESAAYRGIAKRSFEPSGKRFALSESIRAANSISSCPVKKTRTSPMGSSKCTCIAAVTAASK